MKVRNAMFANVVNEALGCEFHFDDFGSFVRLGFKLPLQQRLLRSLREHGMPANHLDGFYRAVGSDQSYDSDRTPNGHRFCDGWDIAERPESKSCERLELVPGKKSGWEQASKLGQELKTATAVRMPSGLMLASRIREFSSGSVVTLVIELKVFHGNLRARAGALS